MTPPVPTDTRHAGGARRRAGLIAGALILAALIGMAILVSLGGPLRPSQAKPSSKVSDVLARTLETRGLDAAVAQYRASRAQGFPGLQEREADTNSLGYRLLGKTQTASAIRVFQLNVETHPDSANAHDSLAEGYLATGNKMMAIENYQKAVALDPKMKTAVYELQRLTNTPRKPYRSLLLLHICAGALGILSGAVALTLRKGSRRHAVVGRVFVGSMLAMSGLATFIAATAPDGEPINVLMGSFTFYLVGTAWWTVRSKSAGVGLFEWGALLVAFAVAAGLVRLGMAGGRFAGVGFFFGGVALLAAGLDLRMILRGGVSGAPRIARHVWRMCTALFIAVTSFFLGQAQVFPYAVRKTGLLALPGVLVVLALLYWLIRVRFTKAYKKATATPIPTRAILNVEEAAV